VTMFTFVTVFGFMNIVIGGLVEHAMKAANEYARHESEAKLHMKLEMVNEFGELMNVDSSSKSDTLSKAEFLETVENSPHLKRLLRNLDFPVGFTMGEMFSLMDSDGDGSVSVREFKSGMGRLVECNPFRSLCILLTSINSLKSLVKEEYKATLTEPCTVRNASDISDLKDDQETSPHCLKQDLAILRREMQDMKVDLTSNLNNLFLLLSPVEGFRQNSSTANMPVWVPLPSDVKKASNISDLQNEEVQVPFPAEQQEDLVILRRELQNIQVDFTSRLNNLVRGLYPLEAFHQSSTVNPISSEQCGISTL